MCKCELTCYFFGAGADPSGEEIEAREGKKEGEEDTLDRWEEFYTPWSLLLSIGLWETF